MASRRTSLLILLFLLILIVFDAAQQKYYMDTFDLAQEPISLGTLLKSHFVRWLAWLVFAVPLGLAVWKKLKGSESLTITGSLLLFAVLITSVSLAILAISVLSIWSQGVPLTNASLTEFLLFFSFQKGLTFFMAYCALILLLKNQVDHLKMYHQQAEIVNLKEASKQLSKTIEILDGGKEPSINIKTGSRLTPILLSEIIWIQADDYCVRVHTSKRSHTLRKSMRKLEDELKDFGFIRIHRAALVNLRFLDQVNFESSTLQLKDASKLPISKTGARTLKKRMRKQSI